MIRGIGWSCPLQFHHRTLQEVSGRKQCTLGSTGLKFSYQILNYIKLKLINHDTSRLNNVSKVKTGKKRLKD